MGKFAVIVGALSKKPLEVFFLAIAHVAINNVGGAIQRNAKFAGCVGKAAFVDSLSLQKFLDNALLTIE